VALSVIAHSLPHNWQFARGVSNIFADWQEAGPNPGASRRVVQWMHRAVHLDFEGA
jgi:hypothetical protein